MIPQYLLSSRPPRINSLPIVTSSFTRPINLASIQSTRNLDDVISQHFGELQRTALTVPAYSAPTTGYGLEIYRMREVRIEGRNFNLPIQLRMDMPAHSGSGNHFLHNNIRQARAAQAGYFSLCQN